VVAKEKVKWLQRRFPVCVLLFTINLKVLEFQSKFIYGKNNFSLTDWEIFQIKKFALLKVKFSVN